MQISHSNRSKVALVTLLFAEVIAVTVPVMILGKYFNFPDILRQPADNAFALFRANQNIIQFGYYIFLMSSLLYIPLSYQLSKWHNTVQPHLNQALVGLGITTAIFQCIGFIRWIFTMPFLTEIYFNNPESKETVSLIYETLNRYAGMSIGEHLGFIAMGSWTIIFGIMLITDDKSSKWLGSIGCFIGLLLIASVAEHFGGQNAQLFGTINFVANTLWTFWLITIAILTAFQKTKEVSTF